MFQLFKKSALVFSLSLIAGYSVSSQANCLEASSNFDLWKEFKKRGLSDNDRLAKLSASCSGSALQIQIEDDLGKRTTKEYSFLSNGVNNCKKYASKIKQGTFLRNDLLSYCGGARCYSVVAQADGTFVEQFKDFSANDRECESKCEAWAKTAHPGYLNDANSTSPHGQ